MRSGLTLLLLALTACSAEPPSGPTSLPPAPTTPPAPSTPPVTRPWPFEGRYELSVSAAASCASQLPAALRVRRYDVVVRTSGERSEIFFEGDGIWSTDGLPYHAHATVSGGRTLLDIHAAEWLRREPLSSAEAFYIMASAQVPGVASRLEGHLDGRLEFLSNRTGSQECASNLHDFYLRPRSDS